MSERQSVAKTVWGRDFSFVTAAVLLTAALAATARAETPKAAATKDKSPAPMRRFKTRYYDLYTDLDDEAVREVATRMTAMAEEYARRIQGFGGRINRRLPFYLFSREEDYFKAGGPTNSRGIYLGTKLMAIADKGRDSRTWYLVQHEGFHQFLFAAMRREIPVWLNEGLAEYFSHGIWTGDGFVMGAVRGYRLLRIKLQIRLGRTLDLAELLEMSTETWMKEMSSRNYDQVWSLVHFLINGEQGKYHKPFGKFLTDVGAGRPWGAAFTRHFGRDTKALQKRHDEWWLSLRLNATPQVYATATVQTLTSFLARAVAEKQKIKDFDDFRAKAGSGQLACRADQWLPPKLLAGALTASRRYRGWQLKRVGAYPSLVLTDKDGNVYTGTFLVRRGRAARVAVTMKPAKKKNNK